MTTRELLFWQRVHRQVAEATPDMAVAIYQAFEILRRALPERQLAELVRRGDVFGAVELLVSATVLGRAFQPVRAQIRRTMADSLRYHARDLPKGGRIDRVVVVAFDHLSPQTAAAIRSIEERALATIATDLRETVRRAIESALLEHRGAGAVAGELGDLIGLTPRWATAVNNLRMELTTGRLGDAAQRVLLDQRFNLANLETLPAAERAARIERIVELYRKEAIAHNASTVARQLTIDAHKRGQALAWSEARAQGVIPENAVLMKTWIGMADLRERDEHRAMNNRSVPADMPYPNNQMIAGEGDWGCRCLDLYQIQRN